MPSESFTPIPEVRRASQSTIGSLFEARARLQPDHVILVEGDREITYRELDERVNRAAGALQGYGVALGDRVAILSENRVEYLEMVLAAAKIGAILACQNWRLAPPELSHCIGLVEPKVVVTSPRHAELLSSIDVDAPVIQLGDDYESKLAAATGSAPNQVVDPEDILLILYTSGTTGLPKGAMLSHRAEIARSTLTGVDHSLGTSETGVAWAPFYHMAATEPAIKAMILGGKVLVVDGFDASRIAEILGSEKLGWLLLMPGMIAPLIEEIRNRNIKPAGVKLCGAMADLVPAHQIAEITALLDAPYVNTFGATETGSCPCSKGVIPVAHVPDGFAKTQSSYCEIKLVDPDDHEVPDGTPGELAFRGPTVFSGYWQADDTNRQDFRGGWFHMGDMFVRNSDGTLDFVDRAKYMIKTGGENVYPAEIERVILADDRVADAIVVRRQDDRWGEVPVAVVAKKDASLTAEELLVACRRDLAGFKQPKAIHFVDFDDLPRSTTGKIQRGKVEGMVAELSAADA